MKSIGLTIAFFAALVFVLPSLTAQDEKKDPDKTDKKDPEKKDDKKDPVKKDEKKKEEKKPVDKLVYATKFYTKVVTVKPDSTRELSIEIKEVDQKKVYENQSWAATRQQQLAKTYASIKPQKDLKQYYQSIANYKKELAAYQDELAKRQQNIYATRSIDVQAADTAKFRAIEPPVEFDDDGFKKKYTKKELDELRGNSGLPGYPVTFDAIRPGQFVEIYMKAAAKKAPAKKKGPDDDDVPEMKSRPEFVLIVILPGGK